MKELTDEQIDEVADLPECSPNMTGWGPKFNYLKFSRAAIAADRALNAPVVPDVEDVAANLAYPYMHRIADSATVLGRIAEKLRVMLASAQAHGGEFVTGYTIKTGALHSILGIMQEVGHSIPLPALNAPADRDVMREVAEVMELVEKYASDTADFVLVGSPVSSCEPIEQAITALITERDTLRAEMKSLRVSIDRSPHCVSRVEVLALIDKMGGTV